MPNHNQNPIHLLLTCEHGGNLIPADYCHSFTGAKEVLESHRGYDLGALKVARFLERQLGVPLFYSLISRLLVDLNRSLSSSELLSEYSKPLNSIAKRNILDNYYTSYRNEVIDHMEKISVTAEILHLSIHTFTPILNGKVRNVDIGILYDESRTVETQFSEALILQLTEKLPQLTVLANEPYKGTDDGFTTYLRQRFSTETYSGIEIEINQKFDGSSHLVQISQQLTDVIAEILHNQP